MLIFVSKKKKIVHGTPPVLDKKGVVAVDPGRIEWVSTISHPADGVQFIHHYSNAEDQEKRKKNFKKTCKVAGEKQTYCTFSCRKSK